jgi:hypothetical protein
VEVLYCRFLPLEEEPEAAMSRHEESFLVGITALSMEAAMILFLIFSGRLQMPLFFDEV